MNVRLNCKEHLVASRKLAKITDNISLIDAVNAIDSKMKTEACNIIHDSVGSSSRVGLLTEAQVTHAGIVNANYGYYKAEKLEDSVPTWLTPFNKPVLAHHNMANDAIGTVVGSFYKSNIPTIIPKVKNSIYESDYTYRGLGYIQNLLNIGDAAAADKVLDGRYNTMSVHGDNDEMTCSICNQEWVNDGKCYHRFGDTYENERTGEEELCFWKAGNFIWSEVSFVNEPADPFAQIINKELTGATKDEILHTYQYKDVTRTDKAVADNIKRLIKFYAINDSKGMKVALNDATSLEALYKLYDVRHTPVGIDLKSKGTESTKVADNINTEAAAAAALTAATAKIEDAIVTPPDVTVIATVTDAKTEAAKVEDVKVAEPAAVVTDSKVAVVEDSVKVLDEKVKTAIADAVKPLEDKIKEHESTVASLTDEKKTLTDKAITLQSEIRDLKLDQVLDLKEMLGVDSYPTIEDRNKAKAAMVSRSEDSINDMINDLKESLKKSKRPSAANVTIGEVGAKALSVQDSLMQELSSMKPEQLIALKMSGKLNLPTLK